MALTLGANPTQGMRPLLVTALAHTLGILIVAVSVYLCYRYAEPIHKGLAHNAGTLNCCTQRIDDEQLCVDVLQTFRCHGDDFAVEQFIAAGLLGSRPGEEFRNCHAFEGRSVHRRTLAWRFAGG